MSSLPRTLLDRLRGVTRGTWALVAVAAVLAVVTPLAVRFQHPPPHHAPLTSLWVTWSLGLLVVTGVLFAKARFDRLTIFIVLAGVGLYLAYLGYTDYGERNYDGGEQLRYVQYVVEHHARPPASYCLICHHPPLFYALGAVVYAGFDATKVTTPIIGLQLYALVCHLVFLGYAAATARRLLATRRELHLATALVVFWPYSIENSVRVHNDTLATTFMAMATFYLVRWAQRSRRRDLYLSAFVTGLGLLTKSSAYVVAGPLLALIVVRFFGARDRLRYARRAAVAALILGAALVLNATGKDSPTSSNAPLCHKILGNACDIHKGQWVENKPKNYLYLDLPAFLREPYAIAERDDSGRAYFWNHLLKSSLLGTHNTIPDRETAYEVNRALAHGMNWLLLAMIAYLVGGAAAFARRRAIRRFGVLLLCLGSCLAFMIGFRVLIPAPHHTDFRHIFSSVVLVSTLYAATAGRARASAPWLERVGRALALPFLALSIVYFLPKHELAVRLTTHVVKRDLARYSKPVSEGSPWDRPGNLIIEESHIVEFDLPAKPTVQEVEATFDNNDRYQIVLYGDTIKRINVGPRLDRKGLVRYVEKIDPPVTHVHAIRVRPLSGDLAYSLGHLIVR